MPHRYASALKRGAVDINRTGNRSGQVFLCLKCGHAGNADVVGSRNILDRFLTGPYGAGYKPYGAMEFS